MAQINPVRHDLSQRLESKYGASWKKDAMEIQLTAENLRTCEPDLMEFFLLHRTAEVDSILGAKAHLADVKAGIVEHDVMAVYRGVHEGRYSKQQFEQWLITGFTDDFAKFNQDFPQLELERYPANAEALFTEIVRRKQAPVFENLVRVYGALVSPAQGYSTLKIRCDGQILTGQPLRDFIHQFPFAVLEPGGNGQSSRPVAEREQYVSADDFLNNPANGLKDNRRPDLIEKRFWSEWRRFLNSPVGKAYANWNTSDVAGLVLQYMQKHDLNPSEQTFRQAAQAVAASISINLDTDTNIHYATATTVSDQGGRQVPVGQLAPVLTGNDDRQWTATETHRLLRSLSADEYQRLLNSDIGFRKAVDKFVV